MYDTNLDATDFIERLSAQEPDALVALWVYGQKNFIPLYRSMGFTPEEAADLWSETYLKLLETKCASYDSRKAPFPVWLKVVARRTGLYRVRQRNRRCDVSLDDHLNLPSEEVFLEENKSGPSELQILVRRVRASLSKNDRTIIWERFVEKLPFDLIAERREITEIAARKQVSRASDRFRQIFERLRCHELPGRTRRVKRGNPPRGAPAGNH